MGCTILLLALMNLKQKKEVGLPSSFWMLDEQLLGALGRTHWSPISTANYQLSWQATLSISMQKQLTGWSLPCHLGAKANLLLIFREGQDFSRRKHLLSACVLAFGTRRNQVAAHGAGRFCPCPWTPSPIPGRFQLPLQLAVNEAQALALGFHKVLLGQQSHQLGCLKFYHQHSSNKCWPKDFWSWGNSCSLSL